MSWQITKGLGPLVATSIHSGHEIRPAVAGLIAVDEEIRLREEDPFTDGWTEIVPNRIIVNTSRFEYDLNRPFRQSVYMTKNDAWGIEVWKYPPPAEIVRESLARYELFYAEVTSFLQSLLSIYRNLVVLDIHSYCHRRGGPDFPPDDPKKNPDINIGTDAIDKHKWSNLINKFMSDLSCFEHGELKLDVRENVKFRGGFFPSWINRHFWGEVCAIAIEVKKTYMDEWTGELYRDRYELVRRALESTIPGLLEELRH